MQLCTQCRVQKGIRSKVLGSWNKEARAQSSFYRVRGAAVATERICSWGTECSCPVCTLGYALTLFVLLGMRLRYLGVCLYSSPEKLLTPEFSFRTCHEIEPLEINWTRSIQAHKSYHYGKAEKLTKRNLFSTQKKERSSSTRKIVVVFLENSLDQIPWMKCIFLFHCFVPSMIHDFLLVFSTVLYRRAEMLLMMCASLPVVAS